MIRTYSTSTLSSRKVREGGSERWGVSKHSVEERQVISRVFGNSPPFGTPSRTLRDERVDYIHALNHHLNIQK